MLTLTWPLTVVLGMLIGSVTFLAQNGTVSSTTTGTILGAIVSGVLVGHYTAAGAGGGGTGG